MKPRILIVEDEESILEALRINLEMEGYEVITATNGAKGLSIIKNQHFNLIILDIMLPDMDGIQLCEQIRLERSEVPVLFLTAKDTGQDKIEGLKAGADDYLTKPFNLEEFLLRVKVLVKHSLKGTEEEKVLNVYTFGSNKIDFQTYLATSRQGEIQLTNKEAKLLKLLIEKEGSVVSRQQILQSVWGYDIYPSTRTIDNFVLAFRKYFEQDPKNPRYFHSIRGIGYKFENPHKK
ncbi:MAG: DNA-binding response regulator [Chitinophagaceae bacterium]|nr:MAG: DNA-binding response regulator [Chitinophagaceae bacterium]